MSNLSRRTVIKGATAITAIATIGVMPIVNAKMPELELTEEQQRLKVVIDVIIASCGKCPLMRDFQIRPRDCPKVKL